MDKVSIGTRIIGRGRPVFIVAEAGVNHNGRGDIALKMVDAAAKAGADAIKFQVFRAADLATPSARMAVYQKKTSPAKNQYGMLRRLELPKREFARIEARAKHRSIIFMATPFDNESADFLDRIGVPAFKISSAEITNHDLLADVARKGKPVILSTGMSEMYQIASAISVLRKNGARQIVLLHCTSDYPCRPDHANLAAINTLRNAFDLPTGFSDHTQGHTADIAATALGAVVIEKHFTLNKKMRGPDHAASLEPAELATMIKAVRLTESMMGSGRKKLQDCERDTALCARKSIAAAVDIPAGSRITRGMICLKRPGTGIPPSGVSRVEGATALRKIRKDTLLFPAHIRYAR